MKPTLSLILLAFSLANPVAAQNQPHVNKILQQLDRNSDGVLTKTEVAENSRYARQFPRWDTNGDGKVSKEDIVKFRARFGIAADGSSLRDRDSAPAPQKFTIPDLSSLTRVDKQTRISRDSAANSQFILKTRPHAVTGKSYFILTDLQDEGYLKSLQRLAKFRKAQIITVEDLAAFSRDKNQLNSVRKRLIDGKAKFVAIAPQLESFRENMLLSIWELLSTLDSDPQLDCFPGFLLASNQESFAKLIDQSIAHQPFPNHEFRPFAINQVQNSQETRSLQKSGILRRHFRTAKIETPIVSIYGQAASTAPRLEGKNVWNLTVQSKGNFIKDLPAEANSALRKSNLVVMHGHGIPGMSCSLDVDGLPADMKGKILLTGSCFSASPVKSDLAAMTKAPGGYDVAARDAFILRAIDNGAIVSFGHQRLSSGFPHLYPVLENWIAGKSVGEAYQRLLNALIDAGDFKHGKFIVPDSQKANRRLPQNRLLYVVIGDPAVQPFQPFDQLGKKE